ARIVCRRSAGPGLRRRLRHGLPRLPPLIRDALDVSLSRGLGIALRALIRGRGLKAVAERLLHVARSVQHAVAQRWPRLHGPRIHDLRLHDAATAGRANIAFHPAAKAIKNNARHVPPPPIANTAISMPWALAAQRTG